MKTRRPRPAGARTAPDDLGRARTLYRKSAWREAYDAFRAADRRRELAAENLFHAAMCAGLVGDDAGMLELLERAHGAHRAEGNLQAAALMAFWLGFRLASLGEEGRASGWFQRAERALDQDGRECAERGYLLIPVVRRHMAAREWKAAHDAAARAAAIGDRFADPDLSAFARNMQGQSLMLAGDVKRGLALLDDAMVSVTGRETSPILTGVIYCNVLQGCQKVYALHRSREWTAALAEWCADLPDVSFAGHCRVRRSEVLQLNGAWQEAIAQARSASEHAAAGSDPTVAAEAAYQEAEVHRLRGAEAEAEDAYRRASGSGLEPQPGLALLRLAQGRIDAAETQVRRVLGAATDPLRRVRFLPAFVEVLLAAGDVEEAEAACRELEEIAREFDTEVLGAMALHSRGAVVLARGDAQGALAPLRAALDAWQKIGAPYLAARVHELVGTACRELGDRDGAALELDAARSAFEKLGARPDRERLDGASPSAEPRPHGLTARELQVLLLVAAGKTNRAIASELFLSERTVDRHLSNIFDKLDVPSRAAATAFAYSHKLV